MSHMAKLIDSHQFALGSNGHDFSTLRIRRVATAAKRGGRGNVLQRRIGS
jgi:hypothetical protein